MRDLNLTAFICALMSWTLFMFGVCSIFVPISFNILQLVLIVIDKNRYIDKKE